MGNVTYEHKYVNAGFDYLDANDQALPTTANIPANGYSIWATPRYPMRERIVVGGADPVRPLDAEHDETTSLRHRPHQIRGRRASATSIRTERSSASPTGFRTREMSARRFCSTTTRRASTTSRAPEVKAVSLHGLLNF